MCLQGNHGYDEGELEEIYDDALMVAQLGLLEDDEANQDEDGEIVH